MNIIDGKHIANSILTYVQRDVDRLRSRGVELTLATITDSENPASRTYIRAQQKMCKSLGIHYLPHELFNHGDDEKNHIINYWINNPSVTGVLLDIPIWIEELRDSIPLNKDVDGISSLSMGKVMNGSATMYPCTASAIYNLLCETDIDIQSKNCVIIGRSDRIGKPVSMMLLNSGATVTTCNSYTLNLKDHCKQADIIISAAGQINLITADMVKPGAVVIDAGICFDENNKICGDVDFENVKELTSYISPVPNGVGPVTVAMLMKNMVTLAKLQHEFMVSY